MLNVLTVSLYTFFTVLACRLFWHSKRANPVFWFIVFQWIIAAGTLAFVNFKNDVEILYGLLFFLSLFSFVVGAQIKASRHDFASLSSTFFLKSIEIDRKLPHIIFIFLSLLSLLVTIYYYKVVGYNLFVDVLLGAEMSDFVSLRLAMYSGEEYFAPGYVNQFKNALLPLALGFVICYLYLVAKHPLRFLGLIVVVFIFMAALLGTGQRGPFLFALAAIVFSFSLIKRINLIKMAILTVPVILLFGVFAVLNLRTEDVTLLESLLALLVRLFMVEQTEGIESFKYIASIKSVYGYEWLEGFMGISPWHPGCYLEHQTFWELHRSDRGTSGVSLVANTYHNGRIPLVVMAYLLMGYGYMSAYYRFLSGRRTYLRIFGYGHIFFILAVLVGGSPVVLVNKGLIVFMFILIIRKVRFSAGSQLNTAVVV